MGLTRQSQSQAAAALARQAATNLRPKPGQAHAWLQALAPLIQPTTAVPSSHGHVIATVPSSAGL
jgi:hypothetical protein